ncbi:hypothetical protein Pecwa_3497 [Pectobacterium parmentieri WPP163]|nr:hypothetical protein Pecwa_3497 [Pectobacterium parmentieri WPP163]
MLRLSPSESTFILKRFSFFIDPVVSHSAVSMEAHYREPIQKRKQI